MCNKNFKKMLIFNTLKRQHLIDPIDNIFNILNDAIGIQCQYIDNAKYALSIRSTKSIDEIKKSDIVKIW